MSKPIKPNFLQTNNTGNYSLGGYAGAVAQGPQGGNSIRNPVQTSSTGNYNLNMGGNSPQPIKYQGITPRDQTTGFMKPEFGYGTGAAGWNSGVQPQWVNQNGFWYGPNGQQLDDATYNRTVGALNGGVGSSSYNASYSSGGGGNYQSAFNAAKAANEARYNQLLSEGEQNRSRMMGYLDNAGATERADLEKGYAAKEGSLRSRMTDYGLGGTSIGDSLSSGLEQAKNRDTSALNERLQGQRLNLDNSLSQQRAGVIERREDPYPDPGMYATIQANSSSSSGGGGSGYSGQTVAPQTRTSTSTYSAANGWHPAGYQNSNYGRPTGVNLDYLTPAALNDAGYMDAFKRTNITSPPRLLTQRQYSS